MTSPALPSVTHPARPLDVAIAALSSARLLELCQTFGCDVRAGQTLRERLAARLSSHLHDDLPLLLRELGRDELRAVCRAFGLDVRHSTRLALQAAVLEAAGLDRRAASLPPASEWADGLPQVGQVVRARHRQWLVEEVHAGHGGAHGDESPLVRLVCLDDDDPGRSIDVLWDVELGARIMTPEAHGLGRPAALDSPSFFGAYLHALKWSAVSSADATLFQAPFRAGIKLMAHQLTPLMKALELPRANLFIADDVGLGKTIEAGLVLQELILRQQAHFVLVVCPASVCIQWQGEMQRRFGLTFEVMTRQLMARRREQRGFGCNPWSTHHRFIVSHALLRRPEHRDALLQHLGQRASRGLLILDEAHVAAPASASKYATDTDITRTIRDLAPRFDNRLFLSATPHNGHSNSFSALLELLDPVRFTRAVPVEGKRDLEPVMVRRLKRDLRRLGIEKFPRRLLVQISIANQGSAWQAEYTAYDAETGETAPPTLSALGDFTSHELVLAEKLARYTALCAPQSGQGRLPFIHLQQRLLSSPEAFARTLTAHAQGLARRGGPVAAPQQQELPLLPAPDLDIDPDTYGESDEETAAEQALAVDRASRLLVSPTEEARQLLSEMRALAEQSRRAPDAKMRALFAWLRQNLCPALGLGEVPLASTQWAPRRVILFTEYADTKRYVTELLTAAAVYTDMGEQRIMTYHGGMNEEARDLVQKAFNSEPHKHPVRILVATDAAREGVNLQGHCADLFHLDIPWNPARLEQRNGRIDRTLQGQSEVRCHYFVYPDRVEDKVLDTVVRKVEVVKNELGSLGAVLLGQLEKALENGISAATRGAVDSVGNDARTALVDTELGARDADLEAVRAEVERAGKRLESSRKVLEIEPESLRGVVQVGLQLAGAGPLVAAGLTSDKRPTYQLPRLDRSWDVTLDVLRDRRDPKTETFWDWRQKPLRPVTFHPLQSLNEDAEQLHLAHPVVRRILDRFLAQGFGAHDLSRVTAVVAPDESVTRVVAYARLTLFGRGAARLHDQLIPVAAPWSGDAASIAPYKDRATAVGAIARVERLLASGAELPNDIISARIQGNAEALFLALWPHLEGEADTIAFEARRGLLLRARREADELRRLLERQSQAIDEAERHLRQGELFKLQDKDQKRQVENDLKHLEQRRKDAAAEAVSEPVAIESLYEVKMIRLSPVGLVVAYPESMT